jgi:hypothetical protein
LHGILRWGLSSRSHRVQLFYTPTGWGSWAVSRLLAVEPSLPQHTFYAASATSSAPSRALTTALCRA